MVFVGCIVDSVTLDKLVGKGCTGGFPPVSSVVVIDPVVSGRLPVALVAVGVCVSGRSVDVTVWELRFGSTNVRPEVYVSDPWGLAYEDGSVADAGSDVAESAG